MPVDLRGFWEDNKPLIGVGAAALVLAVGGWLYFRHRAAGEVAAVEPPAAASAVVPPPAEETTIQHPLAGAGDTAPAAPVPALADSDSSFRDALAQLAGADVVSEYLRPDAIIRNLVVSVDNLPRQKLAVEKRPIRPTSGSFLANGDELHSTLDASNYDRYKPMVGVIGSLDMAKVVAVYTHFYPVFQEAYQNLGYPNGYFNDRLVQVIDLLLATPQPSGPIELVQPNVMYTFADPALESRPAGQKLLIRMGPDNAKVIKAKLMELRALITALPKH